MLKVFLSGALALTLAAPAFAAGDATPTAPKPVKECKNGKVWSEKKNRCTKPENASLTDDQLYDNVRALAHNERFNDAQSVLSAMSDQSEDRVLTYWGFTHRKLGDIALGMTFYEQAITQNPNNILARSYLGQAHVEAGNLAAARAELHEIRQRGGADTWAETSLAAALQSGVTFNY
ncbi:tetratricopeptide repeat protein [Shimia isoporae]|uniref:Tetratricopeptide repeat protein n=1 Tax=Shimia isoporae TaxID=647720 RepID=A0A4R1NL97_9RHOB|nr:tetratricopeptide repeat protein [Shimia isoporae]TCL09126.1 tetratricopeptide repeat protein [Shimia isoporae]